MMSSQTIVSPYVRYLTFYYHLFIQFIIQMFKTVNALSSYISFSKCCQFYYKIFFSTEYVAYFGLSAHLSKNVKLVH